ncbi:uncharacterized protein L969DRAFT_53805 [Mixia osmundae IAM 14324]|uniref:Uncharacterized protein n=1 Tax=Mixia osmundae (strain CBS 9802 / IAM 14324 / JCM 22182 / KY 12970) TaxID=764103 RepID=G7DZF8_MIXOS|nr:uncharacterized protein L969DRAFT_53805 [Mixia osmundae IAM 14324]KEI37139.1 hypothetical protein L969DRAFT_53805 [Mixia osmundae IAM 14324]GAA95968.1 hypothetical protein E5Q_02626 [Mixia osmundae IAM 14324]
MTSAAEAWASRWPLAPLSGYLLTIAVIVGLILPRIAITRSSALFLLFGLGSLGLTWSHMLLYFRWSFENSAQQADAALSTWTAADWLSKTSLFKEAWFTVCRLPERWWWSAQLCTFTTGTWTPFLWAESQRRQIRHAWLFMLMGQMVAISVASSLFFAAWLAATSTTIPMKDTRLLTQICILAVASVLFVPGTITPKGAQSNFLPVILGMHAIIISPLVWRAREPSSPANEQRLRGTYLVSALMSGLIHLVNYVAVFERVTDQPDLLARTGRVMQLLEETISIHPAQSSITWDTIMTSAVACLWILIDVRKQPLSSILSAVGLVLATPIASAGVTVPLYLAMRERQLDLARAQPTKTIKST